jgi:uncharacterized membrane protein YfcA
MEPFSVTTELNLEDWRAYKQAAIAENRKATNPRWRILVFIAIAVVTFALIAFDVPLSGSSFVVGALVASALIFTSYRMNFKTVEYRQRDAFLGPYKYDLGPDGLHASRLGVESSIKWSRIREIVQSRDHLCLWLEQPAAFVVPIRDLPPEVRSDDAVARIKFWMASSDGVSLEQRNEPDFLQTYLVNAEHAHAGPAPKQSLLGTLLKLLALRNSDCKAISGSDRSIGALALLSLALWVVIDRFQVGENAELELYNLPSLTLVAVAILGLAFIFARRSRPNADFRRVLVIVLAILPIAITTTVLATNFLPKQGRLIALLLLFAYTTLYAAKALANLTGSRQPAAAIGGVALCAGLWLLNSTSFDFDASIWYDPSEAEEAAQRGPSAHEKAEGVLFDQRRRIDAAIDAIHTPANVPSANFFVGFAGVGEQKVFAEEIKLASKVVGERYNTGDRSVLLINDRRDLDAYPLATVSGLHFALSQLAKKMDVKRDVLFLALSSHGSEAPELSVANSSLPLNNVTGAALASALNDSGIKWRVIIISACHSGAYIKHLENPQTIVITAAEADKTSFGCSDDRDLTYFGEAFYRDALPNSKSLVDAFNMAKTAIAQREKEEDVTPSNPQAFFGEELRRKLE